MKAFTSAAALAATLSAANALTITIDSTQTCVSDQPPLYTFNIDALSTPVSLSSDFSVCGLHISAAEGVDINSLSCQALKTSADGSLVPGSATFTASLDAQIGTNPFDIAAIECNSTTSVPRLLARASSTLAATGTGSLPKASGSSNGTAPSATGVPTPMPSGNAADQNALSAMAAVGAALIGLGANL